MLGVNECPLFLWHFWRVSRGVFQPKNFTYLIKVSNALSHMTTSEPLCPPLESSIRSVNPA